MLKVLIYPVYYTTWKWHRKIKKKKSALAVKIGLAVKKNYDDLCRKKRVGLSEKKNMGWRLRPENIRFGFSYGIATTPGAYRGDIINPFRWRACKRARGR